MISKQLDSEANVVTDILHMRYENDDNEDLSVRAASSFVVIF